jgi:Threonyl-tRNA synthetase
VVGEKEQSGQTVNIRTRDNIVHGEFTVDSVIQKFKSLQEKRSQDSEAEF